MSLTLLLTASAIALALFALLAGFGLGWRYRAAAANSGQQIVPQACESALHAERPEGPVPAEVVARPCELSGQLPVFEAAPARLAAEGKVMIVDDESINIKIIQKHLKLAGYQQIIGVIDPRTALSTLAQEQPDVVLLDIMMPEISGLEILAQIRADQQWAYLPVIVVTASDNEETKQHALELGATDFLGKPVNGTELVPRVRNALLVKANHDYLKHYAKELERQTRQLEAQIAQARTDPLTGLANRRALDEELQRRYAECRRSASPLSVILLDVDHFKDFNDTHGHRAGDDALRVLAGVLRGAMRQMDVVTRYGGEEFLVILPGTTSDCATLVAERTRQDISKTIFRYDGRESSLTVSVGVAQLAANEQVSRMLERVDQAMYASKEAGRNRTHWHDGRTIHAVLDETAEARSTLDLAPLLGASRSPVEMATANEPGPATWRNKMLVLGHTSDAPLGFQCDSAVFLGLVRQRIAEWKRGGAAFCVLVVQPGQHACPAEAPFADGQDEMLRLTFRILTAVVREMDLIGACEGGRFGALLPRTTLAEADTVAQRLRRHADNCDSPAISLSIGVAEVVEGDDCVRLLERAEANMTAGAELAGQTH